jgi:hypothetical protein
VVAVYPSCPVFKNPTVHILVQRLKPLIAQHAVVGLKAFLPHLWQLFTAAAYYPVQYGFARLAPLVHRMLRARFAPLITLAHTRVIIVAMPIKFPPLRAIAC